MKIPQNLENFVVGSISFMCNMYSDYGFVLVLFNCGFLPGGMDASFHSHVGPQFEQTPETTDSNGIKVKDEGNKEYSAASYGAVNLDCIASSPSRDRIYAVLFSNVNKKTFGRWSQPFKTFHSTLFKDSFIWICVWQKTFIGMNDTVLVNTGTHGNNLLLKEKKRNPHADLPTFMIFIKQNILFTHKGGNEIFSFHIQTHKFRKVVAHRNLKIDCICGSDDHVYIFDKKHPNIIQIFDSALRPVGSTATGLENVLQCDVDMCYVEDQWAANTHTWIISTSAPYPSVRAVNETGVIWQVDSGRCPEFDIRFDPCGVSSSAQGDVFVADRGNDQVGKKLVSYQIYFTFRIRS